MVFSCTRHTIGFLLLAALSLPLYGCGGGGGGGGGDTPPPVTYSMSGKVVAGGNSAGIAGAGVTAKNTATNAVTATQYTDATGSYTISGLVSGTYVVTATYQNNGTTATLQSSTVTVGTANVTAPDVTAPGISALTVSGTVTRVDNNSQPLSGVSIALAQLTSTGTPTGVTYTTYTGSDGRYSISVTASGYYKIAPTLNGYNFATQSGDTTFLVDQAKTIDITAAAQGSGGGIIFN